MSGSLRVPKAKGNPGPGGGLVACPGAATTAAAAALARLIAVAAEHRAVAAGLEGNRRGLTTS